MWRDSLRRIPPSDKSLAKSVELDYAEETSAGFMFASGDVLKDTGMAGLASALAMAERMPRGDRRKGNAATR